MATTSSQTAPLHSVGGVCRTCVRDEHVLVLSLNCSSDRIVTFVRSASISASSQPSGRALLQPTLSRSAPIRSESWLASRKKAHPAKGSCSGGVETGLLDLNQKSCRTDDAFVSSITSRTAVDIVYSPYKDPLMGS